MSNIEDFPMETDKFANVDGTVQPVFDKLIQMPEFWDLEKAKIRFLFSKKAMISKGKKILGKASKFTEKDKFLHSYQFLIVLDREFWERNPSKREPLLHHELCHLALTDDKEPEILPHDLEEFEATVLRYGAWLKDIETFGEQLSLFNSGKEVANG